MKRETGMKNDRIKMTAAAALAILVGCILVVAGTIKGTFGSLNEAMLLSFEQANPVYEKSVDLGTAQESLGLPESLRAVFNFPMDTIIDEPEELEVTEEAIIDEIIDESAAKELTDEDADEIEENESASEELANAKGFQQTEPLAQKDGSYEYEQYGYVAPENEKELRKSEQLVIYTVSYEDGIEAYRVYGTYDGENEGFYACDEDGNVFGIVVDVPVTWYGSYDADTPDKYTFTAQIDDYDYSGRIPTAVITVNPAEETADQESDKPRTEQTDNHAKQDEPQAEQADNNAKQDEPQTEQADNNAKQDDSQTEAASGSGNSERGDEKNISKESQSPMRNPPSLTNTTNTGLRALDVKNAYINGSSTAKNGTQNNPVMVELNDKIKYTIKANNITQPGTSGAKYDVLFVLDWSQSMDIGWMYGEGADMRTARQYELDVMLDMFDIITSKYPDSRVAVMAMNSTGLHDDLARTYLQYDTPFLTPSDYKNGGKEAMELAFTAPWKNPTEDPSTFLNAAIYKMQGVSVSLGSNAGGQKQTAARTAPSGENLADRIPVIVLISDFQIPKNQSVGGISGTNYWSNAMKYQSNRFNSAYPAGILQTVRFDHRGNHTGANSEYSTEPFDLLMQNNVSPNGHSHWGFTKVDMGTPYIAALNTIKADFMALAPPSPGQGTIVIDEVPDGLEVDDISHEGVYDPASHTITWDLYDEDDGEITVWFTATVKEKPKTFENTAEIIFIDGNEAETNTTYHKAGYDTTDVTISKKVIGDYADLTKAFEFDVSLLSLDPSKPLISGQTFIVEGGIISGLGDKPPQYSSLILENDTKLTTFKLKHGQTLTIKNIPSHLMIKVEEATDINYNVSYTDSKYGNTGENDMFFNPVGTDDGTRRFDFVNERKIVIPTGIEDNILPTAIVFIPAVLILSVLGALELKRRKKWGR